MYKRLLGFCLAIAIGWLLVDLLRRRQFSAAQHVPQFGPPYTPDPPARELVEPAIQAELETPPMVEEADFAELAFVAGAISGELSPGSGGEPAAAQSTETTISGYCMRCRTKRDIHDVQIEHTSEGRRMARGTCPVCGTKMTRFLKQESEGAQQ